MLRNDADARRCSYFGLGLPVVLRDLIFGIRIDWFLFLGTNFCDFQKVNINNIFVFIEYLQQNYIVLFSNNTTVCVPYVKPCSICSISLYTVLFLNEREVAIEQYFCVAVFI